MELASTERRGFCFSILSQSIAQLQAVYPEDWQFIASRCDSTICLGFTDLETLEFIDQRIKDVGVAQTAEPDAAQSFLARRLRREPPVLFYESKYPELTTLRADECLILSRGAVPCKLFKFNPEKHPFYSKLHKIDRPTLRCLSRENWRDALLQRRDLGGIDPSPELSSAQSIRFDNYSVDELVAFINDFIQRTDPVANNYDLFWLKAETALLKACFFFLHSECNAEDQSLAGVMKLLRCVNAAEGQESEISTLDVLLEELEANDPDHIAVRWYTIYKGAADKAIIKASCEARLAFFCDQFG